MPVRSGYFVNSVAVPSLKLESTFAPTQDVIIQEQNRALERLLLHCKPKAGEIVILVLVSLLLQLDDLQGLPSGQ